MGNCSVDLQRNILGTVMKSGSKDISSLNEVIKRIDPTYDLQKCLDDFDPANKAALTKYVEVVTKQPISVLLSSSVTDDKAKPNKKPERRKYVNSLGTSNFQSSEILDMFYSMGVANNFFELETKRVLTEAIYIGDESSDHFVRNDAEINMNLKLLKNKLFKDIVDYLISKNSLTGSERFYNSDNKFIANLYNDASGEFLKDNYSLYMSAINDLDNLFFKDSEKRSYTQKLLPNIKANIIKAESRKTLQIYNNAILLVNFDNVMAKYMSNMISVNYAKFNEFEDNSNANKDDSENKLNNAKYKAKTKGFETPYWLQDNHESEGASNLDDDLTKTIASIIPIYNKNEEQTPYYMDTKKLNHIASLIKNFEVKNFNMLINDENFNKDWIPYSENSKASLDWYLDRIIEGSKVNFTDIYSIFVDFKNVVETAISLKKFNERIKTKEENSTRSVMSVIRHVLNNGHGAIYTVANAQRKTFDTIEMFSHNAARVAHQNAMYANFDKFSESADRFAEPSDEDLEKLLKDPIALSKKINSVLGVYLGEEGGTKLIEYLNLNQDKDSKILLRSIFRDIKQSDVITAVIENESKLDQGLIAEVETHSEVISKVLESPVINAIMDIALELFPYEPITTISKSTGEKIPTYKLATLTYSDTEILKTHADTVKNNEEKNHKSIFIQGTEPVLLGTGTKLEVVNKDLSKDIDKLSEHELFLSNFNYDFLNNLEDVNKGGISGIHILLGNYSDKSTILTKIINRDVKYGEKYIIGNEDINKVMSLDDLKELVRSQNFAYYHDLFTELFNQYDLLFKALNLPKLKGTFDDKVATINKYLQSKTKTELLKDQHSAWLINPEIELTEELHYSNYANGIALNQLLVNNYRIMSSTENFNNFAKIQEQSLINKFKSVTGSNKIFDFSEMEFNQIRDNYSEKDQLLHRAKFLGFNNFNKQNIEYKGELNPLVQKWMWVNALFRTEYLNISTKNETNHPHKVKGLKFTEDFKLDSNGIYKRNGKSIAESSDFNAEMSGRLSSMAKRNVAFTATIERPVKNSKYGVTNKINIATIQDYSSQVYNYDGKTKNQEIHDGGSFINYLQSKMIEASYPGKGYVGTKKQFGTFVSELSSSVKKDAETIITNNKIRESFNSVIRFREINRKMLSSHKININNFKKSLQSNNYFWKDGEYYQISSYSIDNNELTLDLYKRTPIGKWQSVKDDTLTKRKIDTLYDLWDAFGAEFSVNQELKFNEGSNELLYDLITEYSENGEYILKDKMIHVLSNHSAIKSGATRLNLKSSWTDNSKLMFTSFDNKYIGPQLDANHDSEGSETKEVTQVLSALAQGQLTSELAADIYDNIAKIIKIAAEPYIDNVNSTNNQRLLKTLSKKFFDGLLTSDNVSLAKAIAQTFDNGALIPFSNQNFFQLFVRDVITRMNNEFITRYYSGLPGILNPSHKIIQVLEDKKGNVYTQEDILNKVIELYKTIPGVTFKEKYDNYLAKNFSNEPNVPISEIKPGDTILVDNQYLTFDNINTYYEFKKANKNTVVTKVYSVPRDLKPQEMSYSTSSGNTNLFDSDSVRLRYEYNTLINKIKELLKVTPEVEVNQKINELIESDEDYQLIKKLTDFWKINITDTKKVSRYFQAWTQRNLQLIENELIMNPIKITDNLDLYFGDDNIISDVYRDVEQHYLKNNSQRVHDYKFKPAEIIMPNINKGIFNTGSDSLSKIKSKGYNYFGEKLRKLYTITDEKVDLKLIVGDSHVLVKYVTKLPSITNEKLYKSEFEYVNGAYTEVKYRIDEFGNKAYKIPENSTVRVENGIDTVYIKTGHYQELPKYNEKSLAKVAERYKLTEEKIEEYKNKTENKLVIDEKEILNRVNYLIDSFEGELKAIIPLSNTDLHGVTNKNNYIRSSFINNRIFSRFTGFDLNVSTNTDNWFNDNIGTIIDNLAKKQFASWQKSNQFVAARIPAQSMQSFQEMEAVGYINTNSNDVYVSVWQIWIQGSDFDIDKVYLMGYGFNKKGNYDTWGHLRNYSSVEQLNELEKLPLPSIDVNSSNKHFDITSEIIDFFSEPYDSTELTVNQLKILNKILKINKEYSLTYNTDNDELFEKFDINNTDDDELFEKFDIIRDIIFNYNNDTLYQNKKHAVKNSVIANMRRIISSPSNQIDANEPIDVDPFHEAVANLNLPQSVPLSSWDMFSYYKQQKDASVGKEDVGIGANGVKVLFNLTNYYNNLFKNNPVLSDEDLRYYAFNKNIFTGFEGEDNQMTLRLIADANASREQIKQIDKYYSTSDTKIRRVRAAVIASAFVSAATDNAKELLMAKINATPDLASVHMYMMFLGFDIDQISEYMNKPLVVHILRELETNIFDSESKIKFVPQIIGEYISNNELNEIELQYVKGFSELYEGAQEFKILASILKVNQKTSANIKELNKFLNKFENAIYSRENFVFGKGLQNMRNIEPEQLEKTVNIILAKNENLVKSDETKEYIRKTLRNANEVEIEIDGKKQIVSLLGGQFDVRYFINDSTENYKKATIEYYNLFKSTVNLFHVIDKSSQFKEMINGLILSHKILIKSSKKYDFIFNKGRSIIDSRSSELHKHKTENNKLTTILGNSAFKIKLDDNRLNRLAVWFDKKLVAEWLKKTPDSENSRPQVNDLTFNVKDLLNLAGLRSIRLYIDDSAKQFNRNDNNITGTKVITNQDNFIVSLNTDSGIANFKLLMENVLFEILKNNEEPISNSLRIIKVKNHYGNSSNQIVSNFPISQLNSPVNADKFQVLLDEFNDLDRKAKVKIRNAFNKNLAWKDLFYVYNLIVNNESYGDKRLTPLFEDYIKDKNTLGYDYLNFASDVDGGKIDLFSIDDQLNFATSQNNLTEDQIKELRQELITKLENDILFTVFQKNGELRLNNPNLTLGKKGEVVQLKLLNADYPINSSMDLTLSTEREAYKETLDLLQAIRGGNIIITFNCI